MKSSNLNWYILSGPHHQSFFNIGQRYPLTFLTRMRLGFCALKHFLFSRNIVDSPKFSCGSPCENLVHYLIHCPLHAYPRTRLNATLAAILQNKRPLNNLNDKCLVERLISGSPSLNWEKNNVELLPSTKRFCKWFLPSTISFVSSLSTCLHVSLLYLVLNCLHACFETIVFIYSTYLLIYSFIYSFTYLFIYLYSCIISLPICLFNISFISFFLYVLSNENKKYCIFSTNSKSTRLVYVTID